MTDPIAPPVPAVRSQALRHHLMSEFRRPARPPRRQLLVLVPVAAAVLVAAVGAVLLAQPRSAPLVVTVAQGDPAALFLQQMAAAATGEPGPSPVPGAYLYIKSRVAVAEVGDGPARLHPLHDREIWIPLDRRGDGLLREATLDLPLIGAVPRTRKLPDMRPNAETVDLPTDPDLLLRQLYRQRAGQGNSPDEAVFTAIGDILFESLVPPLTRAALYRAAARIPGIEVVRGVTDAVGRPGVAVGRTDRGWRHEWIFDERTYEYLGARSYLVAATVVGPAGTVLGMSAVIRRAVVPELGKRP